MTYITDTIETFKKYFYTKNLFDFLIFVILITLIIMVVQLFHYSNIQEKVIKNSRCNNIIKDKVDYKITGVSFNNIEIFEITYNFKNKSFTIEQKCPVGTSKNTIKIPVYNMRTYTVEEIEKIFECDQDYDLNNGLFYKGPSELVKFMQVQNTDFFDKILFN